jgi:hypothetical protein
MFSERSRSARPGAAVVAATLVLASSLAGAGAGPRFFPDDPIAVDNDRALDAGGVRPIEGSNLYDFVEHTFRDLADRRQIRAVNVNTIDEVPDSSWFTGRIGVRPMSIDDIARGPNELERLSIDGWPIVQEKSSGITPGYRVVDPSGRMYQVKFDPPDHPEMGSAAEIIGAAIYHALGYNVVQGYIVEIDPERIVVDPKATTVDLAGRRRTMRRSDVDRILKKAARQPNGKYRALASRFADGRPVGYFKYFGTRPDDPNDIHPHEHRRELRANRVFAAWLNHDDSRGLNTLDMLEGAKGRQWIRHYMFDFGSTLGSGSTVAQVPRAGNEYILEWAPALKTLFTFGLYVRPWMKVDYWEEAKAVGRFEAAAFDPVLWRPEYPNPAFDNMRPDDAFWGARLVARFTDGIVRAIAARARYSEKGAAEHVASTLIARRDKVLRAWLTGVNPIASPRLDSDGTLTFENVAVEAGVASPGATYALRWSRFDNATGTRQGDAIAAHVTGPRAVMPLPLAGSAFVEVAIETIHADFPAWRQPAIVHFGRTAGGWQLVGLKRSPGPAETMNDGS